MISIDKAVDQLTEDFRYEKGFVGVGIGENDTIHLYVEKNTHHWKRKDFSNYHFPVKIMAIGKIKLE